MSMITIHKIQPEATPVEENPMGLLPGFRFHPTDDEIVVHYLIPKVMNNDFSAVAIGHVDFNKCEPWDLPKVNVYTGDTTERYYYCLRDKKYPTGLRTNRATKAGYWKATGKDREICMGGNTDSKVLVGMKKTLVFYKGRAPRGEKTNWVMHEFRLHSQSNKLPKDDYGWVVSRVFHKNADGNNGMPKRMASSINNVRFSPEQVSDDSLTTNHEHELIINGNEYDNSLPCLSNHQLQDLKLATIEPSDEDQLLYLADPYYYYPKLPETTLFQTHGTYGADDDVSVLESFNFKVEEYFASNNAGNGFSSDVGLNAMINNNGNDVETPYSNEQDDELQGFLPSTMGSVQDLSNMWNV